MLFRSWWWLAQRVLDARTIATIVRFEDLHADPARSAQSILDGTPLQPGTLMAVDSDASVLDDADRQAIRAICLQAAYELGMSD